MLVENPNVTGCFWEVPCCLFASSNVVHVMVMVANHLTRFTHQRSSCGILSFYHCTVYVLVMHVKPYLKHVLICIRLSGKRDGLLVSVCCCCCARWYNLVSNHFHNKIMPDSVAWISPYVLYRLSNKMHASIVQHQFYVNICVNKVTALFQQSYQETFDGIPSHLLA